MKRIELVELIEGMIAKLSPEGRETFEEIELLIETRRPGQDVWPEVERIFTHSEGPRKDDAPLKALFWLQVGLRVEDIAKDRSEEGEFREGFVVAAAAAKDRAEGRPVDPDMNVDQAMARLEEDS